MKPGKQTKVLLVDDVRLFLELERTFFSRQGCEIFIATNGANALKLIEQETPDLVVLDLYLPEISGLEVLKQMRSREEIKDIKVIMVTVSTKEEDIQACNEAGCDAYLTKPFTQKDLIDTAARLLNVPQRIDLRIWVEMEVGGEREGEKFYGQSDNISVGGIHIKSDRSFHPGSILKLRFSLPERDEIISAQVKVLRSEDLVPIQDKNKYGLACSFVDLDDESREQIAAFIGKTAASE